MKPATRKIVIGLLLALTAAAAFWPLPEDDAAVSPRASKRPAGKDAAAASRAAERALPTLRSSDGAKPATELQVSAAAANLFPSQTWMPPPSPPPQDTAPVAPPLPFTFGGRYVEAGRTMAFLLEGERVHSVRVGDTIKGAYRIDAIEPAAVQLTYLPLNIRQSLPTGSMTP